MNTALPTRFRPRSRRSPRALALLALLAIVRPLAAQPDAQDARAIIIDEQLIARTVSIVSLDERLLSFIDEQQRQRTLARPSLLALVPLHEGTLAPPPMRGNADTGLLILTSGERFEGDLQPTGGGDETLAWIHPLFGTLDVPIERVAAFWRPDTEASVRVLSAEPPRSDVLYLNNQDSLSGFLASAGDPLRVESDAGISDVPADRVVGAVLANPPVSPSGVRVWIDGDTAAGVSRFTFESAQRATFSGPGGASFSVNWNQLRAVSFDTARLRPLAGIAPTQQVPVPGRRFAPPIAETIDAPLDAADLQFPGPMSVTWDLPPGAQRLAFSASLAEGAAPWGDCELVVALDGAELTRRRLTPEAPPAAVSLPLAGRSLTISVQPGRYGPIRDWVVLSRPLILVGANSESASE